MVATPKKKFTTQADPQLLKELIEISKVEGRQFQAVLEEAMGMLIAQRKNQGIRHSAMAHYKSSLEKNRRLAELLA
jgi:hypothetical protein